MIVLLATVLVIWPGRAASPVVPAAAAAIRGIARSGIAQASM